MAISIGILAGMGPRSTAPFIDLLVTECQQQYGARDDIDFPLMHIISLPTPFRPGQAVDDAAMIAALTAGIKQLVAAGVDVIAVPCNLAHCYFAEMQQAAAGVPLLHIADSTLLKLPTTARQIMVLATEPTLQSGFYQQRLRDSGYLYSEPPALRGLTTQLIAEIKQHGFSSPDAAILWQQLSALTRQADAVLVACTDITPLIARYPDDQLHLDTAQSLAQATIGYYLSARKS